MEQNISDLIKDAFSDTDFPSHREDDLNFDTLNFDESDDERTESISFNWLSGLKEVDEDLEKLEGTMEVLSSISGEERQWVLQKQCSGDIQHVGPLQDDVTVEMGNEDRDLKGDRDEDDKQALSNKERDSTEDEGDKDVQGPSNKERDSTEDEGDEDVQGPSNKERDSTEDEGDEDVQGPSNKERDSTEDEGDEDVQGTSNKERDSTEDEGDEDVQGTSNKETDSTEDEGDEDVQGPSNKERDSTEDEGDEDVQGLSNKERDSTEDEGDEDVQGPSNKERDSTEDEGDEDVQGTSNKERDSTEDEGDEDVQGTSNKETDSTEDEGDEDVQGPSNKERDSTEDEGDEDVQGLSNKERDSTEDESDEDVQGTSNKERDSTDSTEYEQEDVEMGDFGHPAYLSQVASLKGQYLEEREEVTDYQESTQILFQDEQDIGGDETTMKVTFSHVLPPHAEMQQEGGTNERLESKEEKKDEDEKDTIAGAHSRTKEFFSDGLLSLGKDDFSKQFLEGLHHHHHHQLGGDLKEFSEDDQGVIGEGYAEYPLECFQQEDEEDRKKEVGGIKTELTQETGRLEGNAPLEGELSEWELLEKHTDLCKDHLPWKETIGDLLKENDAFVLEKITEEQGSEEDWLEEENINMEEEDMGRRAEGERHVLEETGALFSFSPSERDREELEDPESFKATKGSEASEEEFTDGEHSDAHRQEFCGTRDESPEERLCKNEAEEAERGQENDGESGFGCTGDDGQGDFREREERNDGYPGRNTLLESLGAWDTQTSGISFSGTDSDRSSEDSFSLSKPLEASSHPSTRPKDGTDPASPNISEQTEWLPSEASAPETKDFGYREEPEEELAARRPPDHEAYGAVGVEEHEVRDDEEDEDVQERNWEQEKERIEAFYRYYNDDQDDAAENAASNGSERKHTVRFCLQPNLPTDSSDIDDGVSSSSDEAEERDTPVNRMALDFEEDDDGERRREDFVLLLQQTQVTQREILKLSTELKAHRRRNKVSSPLYGCLKISLVTVLGVLFFWWATDQLEWME